MLFLRLVGMAGHEKTPSMSLGSALIMHAIDETYLFEAAGTDRHREILSTGKVLRAMAQWVMGEGLLAQFSLAKEQIDQVEGRAGTSRRGGGGRGDPGPRVREKNSCTNTQGTVTKERDLIRKEHIRENILLLRVS